MPQYKPLWFRYSYPLDPYRPLGTQPSISRADKGPDVFRASKEPPSYNVMISLRGQFSVRGAFINQAADRLSSIPLAFFVLVKPY
jgi:hypothetical protein